jgi:DHA1 family tetracycline resistance protein-like MFS transporter
MRTIIAALLLMSAGLALLALSSATGMLLAGVGLMAGCFNIAMPSVVGLASRRSTENEQGSLMGTVSSAINIASLVGPVLGNAVYSISMRGNYLFASAVGLAAVAMVYAGLRRHAER